MHMSKDSKAGPLPHLMQWASRCQGPSKQSSLQSGDPQHFSLKDSISAVTELLFSSVQSLNGPRRAANTSSLRAFSCLEPFGFIGNQTHAFLSQ